MKKTLPDMLACAQRELVFRRKLYPKWIAERRLSAEIAEHELACMESIIALIKEALAKSSTISQPNLL